MVRTLDLRDYASPAKNFQAPGLLLAIQLNHGQLVKVFMNIAIETSHL